MPAHATYLRWIYTLGFLWPLGIIVLAGDFIFFMMTVSFGRFSWQFAVQTLCLTICGLLITLSPIVLGVLIQRGKRINMWLLHTSNALAIGILFLLGHDKPLEAISWEITLYGAAFFAFGYLLNYSNKHSTAINNP